MIKILNKIVYLSQDFILQIIKYLNIDITYSSGTGYVNIAESLMLVVVIATSFRAARTEVLSNLSQDV